MQVMTNEVGVVDFQITPAQQKELYENGRKAARTFMRTWNWDRYCERFRMGTPDAVAAAV
jgi:NTE family protein